MLFGIVLIGLLTAQAMSALVYWRGGAEPERAAAQLRIASAAIGIGLIALVIVAWDGLAIEASACSSYPGPSYLRSGEEYVLGSSLVAAALALIVALSATLSRRVVPWLVGLALASTVLAALYLASHAYWASCWGP
jgi:hypothetical protein